ncbi:uncharacterized protein EV420DRAFT_1479369 [Desarmillaria tabescens]|uniref:Uncharacterized protein n=1 Tax=Armillaria tabescens TaxID=1929756 RepID=A0AA39KG94_ARMTA|nr:uncharacterized protein EV420DRAFT_1479369 [Desarmillaria tabescens]KAK0459390.1 hypothetical protein EV420DRAFT_1479369 [Desarmillaria tabescens]
MVSIKKPQKFAKGQTVGPTSMPEDMDDDDDAGNSLDEESVVIAKPFRPPASQGSPSKHTKPGPNRHSVAAVPPSIDLPVGVVEEQVIRTRGEKRKREAAIAAVESHVETSNVRDESPELLRKMTKQHMAQLSRQAAAQVPSQNIAFDPVTMQPVDADEVRWLATTTMDPKVPCSLCAVGSQSKPCEFMGWGVPCGNCQRGKKVVCSFKASPQERYRARVSIHPFAERTPDNLRRLLGTAEYLVKAFDSACETAGRLSELLCDTCKDIDAVIRDTVEYEGRVVAEESLVTDVSAVNRLLDGFSAQEVEVLMTPENEDRTGPSLFLLSYDASSPKRDEALRREEGGGGEMDADGDLDAEPVTLAFPFIDKGFADEPSAADEAAACPVAAFALALAASTGKSANDMIISEWLSAEFLALLELLADVDTEFEELVAETHGIVGFGDESGEIDRNFGAGRHGECE